MPMPESGDMLGCTIDSDDALLGILRLAIVAALVAMHLGVSEN